jgi:hypothetical protein
VGGRLGKGIKPGFIVLLRTQRRVLGDAFADPARI